MTERPHRIEEDHFRSLLERNLFEFNPEAENKDWTIFVTHETENCSCTIYRKPQDGDNASLFEYFTTGTWRNIDAEMLYLCGLDGDYRKSWDETTIDYEVLFRD
jgi:hypothetical protein